MNNKDICSECGNVLVDDVQVCAKCKSITHAGYASLKFWFVCWIFIALLSFSCAYTPARAYKLTDKEIHDAKHEYLSRSVKDLQERVQELENE